MSQSQVQALINCISQMFPELNPGEVVEGCAQLIKEDESISLLGRTHEKLIVISEKLEDETLDFESGFDLDQGSSYRIYFGAISDLECFTPVRTLSCGAATELTCDNLDVGFTAPYMGLKIVVNGTEAESAVVFSG